MSHRHLPVRPRLDQLQQQASDLLRGIASGNAEAIEELREHHPQPVQPASATLDDAQLTLARSYRVGNWPRLVLACRLIDAIWRDDVDTIRSMVGDRPALLHEMARGTDSCNWGPPMSYAANLGRDRTIDALLDLGAVDLESAFIRATLQSQIGTARKLYEIAGRPLMPQDAAMGPAEALSAAGMLLVLELGGAITDGNGDWRGAVALTLETYSRNRDDKHRILEIMSDPTPGLQPTETGSEGHPPLFTAMQGDHFARLLLDRGADPNARASLRKRDYDDHVPHEHREVTPLAWGQRYHDPRCASEAAMRLVAERGGRP
jgi:hypothetical protein